MTEMLGSLSLIGKAQAGAREEMGTFVLPSGTGHTEGTAQVPVSHQERWVVLVDD